MDNITFRLELEDGTHDVTIPLDFSDFSVAEARLVAQLIDTDETAPHAIAAFLFVRLMRDIDVDVESLEAFRSSIVPLLEGDTSNLIVEGVEA